MVWQQIYDPFGNMVISTALAAVPVVVMLVAWASCTSRRTSPPAWAWWPRCWWRCWPTACRPAWPARAAMYGGFTGLLPIGWIVLNIIFLQQLAEQNGSFKILQDSLSGITEDRRLQLLLIAFCFGAFFEGAAGFGTPVAVTAGILIGLGFSPLAASGLSLIANTAPVAFGALGTPVITLAKVHGYDLMEVTAMIGRQLPFFSLLVPFWLIWAFAGRKAMMGDLAGDSGHRPVVRHPAVPGVATSSARSWWTSSPPSSRWSAWWLFLRVWQPKKIWTSPSLQGPRQSARTRPSRRAPVMQHARAELVRAWTPWVDPDRVRLRLGPAAGEGLPERPVRAQASRSTGCTT